MPDFLCGVTNLRGAVIPVVDLLARFGKGVTAIGKRTCIVIIEVKNEDEKTPLGILVNSVNAVLPVDHEHIESRPSFGTSIRADFIEALLNLGGNFVIALDVQQVLSIEEMSGIARSLGGSDSHGNGE
jgi:purine-binding chemotaxis protein CheW